MINFIFFEVILGLTVVVVWKGTYDLAEKGAQNLFKENYPDLFNEISIAFVGVLCYISYFILM